MELKIATDADSDKVLEFYTKTTLPGDVEVRFRRMYNFFNYYSLQSDDHVTYLLLDDNKQILAMATLLFYKAYIDNEIKTVCYATDLRIAKSRKAILHWAKHFLPLIEEETKKRGCDYVFSTVARSQRQAYNALIRPRNLKRRIPRYHLFRKFKLINIHGLWPIHRGPLDGIKIASAKESDFEALAEYYGKRYQERPFHRIQQAEDFLKMIRRWTDLKVEDFMIAKNYKGEIIGATALWSSQKTQRHFAVNYSPSGENFRHALMWMSPFSKIHRLPAKNNELHPRFLCFLQVDNPDVHRSLMHHAFDKIDKTEFLTYLHFSGELATLPPKGFISSEVKYSLFCLLQPNAEIPNFLKPSLYSPGPAFEPAWI